VNALGIVILCALCAGTAWILMMISKGERK